MAWRRIFFVSASVRPRFRAMSANEASEPTGKLVAMLNFSIAWRLMRELHWKLSVYSHGQQFEISYRVSRENLSRSQSKIVEFVRRVKDRFSGFGNLRRERRNVRSIDFERGRSNSLATKVGVQRFGAGLDDTCKLYNSCVGGYCLLQSAA